MAVTIPIPDGIVSWSRSPAAVVLRAPTGETLSTNFTATFPALSSVLMMGDSVSDPEDRTVDDGWSWVSSLSGAATTRSVCERTRAGLLFDFAPRLDPSDFRSDPFPSPAPAFPGAVPSDAFCLAFWPFRLPVVTSGSLGLFAEVGFLARGVAREDFLATGLAQGTDG